MTMADTIAVLNKGKVEQMGAPVDLYENPATAFVSGFLGQSNLLPATIVSRDSDVISLKSEGFRLAMPASRAHTEGPQVQVGVRPEKIQLADEGQAPGGNVIDGTIIDASFIGVSTQYLIRTPADEELSVFSQNTATTLRKVGEKVSCYWDPAHTFALESTADQVAFAAEVAS